jgi:hypothetical protein
MLKTGVGENQKAVFFAQRFFRRFFSVLKAIKHSAIEALLWRRAQNDF